MIRTSQGKYQTTRDRDELQALLETDVARLSEEEREAFVQLLAEVKGGGTPETLEWILGAEYKETPVDIETFVKDPYYLGETCATVYPLQLKILKDIFEGGYSEALLLGSIGYGKCCRLDTSWVIVDGRRVLMRDLLEQDPNVASFEDGRIRWAKASRIWHSGRKECVKITLGSGQWFEGSEDHPVLTPAGYVPFSKILEGDLVATPRYLPEPSDPIGVTKKTLEVWANSKKMPPEVWALSNSDLAYYLRHLYGTFGKVELSAPGKLVIHTSHAQEIQELLRRFGVVGRRIKARRVQVAGAANVIQFLDKIGKIPGQEGACDVLRTRVEVLRDFSTVDIVPLSESDMAEVRKEVETARLTTARAKKSSRRAVLENVSKTPDENGVCISGHTSNVAYQTEGAADPNQGAAEEDIDDREWRVTEREWRKFGMFNGVVGRRRFERLVEHFQYTGKHSHHAHDEIVWERVIRNEWTGLHEVGDLTVPGPANAVVNGVIVHNTFVASIGLCYVLYRISCLRDPHRSLGIANDTQIAVTVFSVNEDLAARVAFDNIAQKIKPSPYFQRKFPFKPTKKHMRFPDNVWVMARASTDTSAIGLNVVSAMLDEANFLHSKPDKLKPGAYVEQSETIYKAVKRRIKSRFDRHGRVPGVFFVVSSKTHNDDFTTRRVREARNDPHTYACDYAIWEVKPEVYSKRKFQVLVGSEKVRSRILTPEEAAVYRSRELDEQAIVIDVPEDFRTDFETDLEGAIRDLAGVSTVAINPFIAQRDKILSAVDPSRTHPYSMESMNPENPGEIAWDALVQKYERKPSSIASVEDAETFMGPKVNPGVYRFVHVDPALTGDALGFCIAHISGHKDVPRRSNGRDGRQAGELYTERAPLFHVDFMLQVIPPPGGEIVLGDIRQLIYDFDAVGFKINKVTFDSYQSADMKQQLRAKGYNAEVLSVDVTPDAYDHLKLAIYEERVAYYHYEPLVVELRHLQEDRKGTRRKIDHPKRMEGRKGSKDVADALAGVLHSLNQDRESASVPWISDMLRAIPEAPPRLPPGVRILPTAEVPVKQEPFFFPFLGGGFGNG